MVQYHENEDDIETDQLNGSKHFEQSSFDKRDGHLATQPVEKLRAATAIGRLHVHRKKSAIMIPQSVDVSNCSIEMNEPLEEPHMNMTFNGSARMSVD